MNPFFLFELEQHTPLLHFQSKQHNAGLRATEVKPKLDKFIWSKLDRDTRETFLRDGVFRKTDAGNYFGNYKMHVKGKWREEPKDPGKVAKGYFGNMGAEDKSKKKIVWLTDVQMELQCFYPDLQKVIKSHIAEFFRTHNFGCRQNRGYGSFTIKDDREAPPVVDGRFKVDRNFYHTVKTYDLSLITLEAIDWFYRSLRQGINHGSFDKHKNKFIHLLYMKPMLFQYAASKGIQWEKKTIKERFFGGALARQVQKHQGSENDPLNYAAPEDQKRLVRDLFGLSSQESWKGYCNGKTSITKEDVDGEIERYPSPLTFKVIAGEEKNSMIVYFWKREIEECYQAARFRIRVNGKDRGCQPLQIWEDFDWDDFFAFAFESGRLEDSIQLHDILKSRSDFRALSDRRDGVEKLLKNIYQDIIKYRHDHQ